MLLSSVALFLVNTAVYRLHRRRLALVLFATLYLAVLMLPINMKNTVTWTCVTALLLPCRTLVTAETVYNELRAVPARRLVVCTCLVASVAMLLILVCCSRLDASWLTLVRLRQYAQIVMALFLAFTLLYTVLCLGQVLASSLVTLVFLTDYAVASAFDARTGLAAGFFAVDHSVWRAVHVASNVALALCFLAWTAVERGATKEVGSQNDQKEGQCSSNVSKHNILL